MKNNRFERTEALLGKQGLQKLKNAHIAIIGIGAVGGYAMEALARAGVGSLTLVDSDTVDITNINRQIIALSSTIGQDKIEAAKKRVLDINPDCKVSTKKVFVNQDTIEDVFAKDTPDFVIDAIDSLNPKCCLMEYLYNQGISFVSSMGAALKTDPKFIKLGSLSSSKNCGLAKFIRKRLKKRGLELGKITCVYSDEQTTLPESAIYQDDTSSSTTGRQRNTLGSLPTITAIFGLTMANHAIMHISSNP